MPQANIFSYEFALWHGWFGVGGAVAAIRSRGSFPFRLQGLTDRVHPILALLAVIAAGAIDGLRGAVFAVPTPAVIGVLFDFFFVRLRVHP